MRILLIAYEFPPGPSPQSLRWFYLSSELAAAGHDVHVLAPDIKSWKEGIVDEPGNVKVHRAFPGLHARLAHGVRRQVTKNKATKPETKEGQAPARIQADARPLNWKGRLRHRVGDFKRSIPSKMLRAYSSLLFPDLRGEWTFWARRRMQALLRELKPDLVIASHEPALTLELALQAHSAGFDVWADLGDPVLATYTEERWRERSYQVESAICNKAVLVTVTCESAKQLLVERHGGDAARIEVVTQGFVADRSGIGVYDYDRESVLELLYTGSFYSFRDPMALVRAVLATPDSRLSIASAAVPDELRHVAARNPDKLRLLGFLPHHSVLAAQREADVLVNIDNADPAQVPGKFYEYLGAGRPILQVSDDPCSAPGRIIQEKQRGWVCRNEQQELTALLLELVEKKRNAILDCQLQLGMQAVCEYSWESIAANINAVVSSKSKLVPTSMEDQIHSK